MQLVSLRRFQNTVIKPYAMPIGPCSRQTSFQNRRIVQPLLPSLFVQLFQHVGDQQDIRMPLTRKTIAKPGTQCDGNNLPPTLAAPSNRKTTPPTRTIFKVMKRFLASFSLSSSIASNAVVNSVHGFNDQIGTCLAQFCQRDDSPSRRRSYATRCHAHMDIINSVADHHRCLPPQRRYRPRPDGSLTDAVLMDDGRRFAATQTGP